MKAGRQLRFSAVLVAVVLALTGFQTGKSSGGSGGKSRSGKSSGKSSGGGCSSSKKKNHDYDHDDEDSYDDSSGSGSYTTGPTPTPTATSTALVDVVVVDCVKPAQKKRKGRPARKADYTASVRITSRETVTETFRVKLEFQDAAGTERGEGYKDVTVEPGATETFDVLTDAPTMVDRVRKCVVEGVSVQ
ncbi:hypothetical protein AB0C77_17845 [Streptomyces sp. NPDC048629]|uniref:hypothetical protein n=1 Tax=Streptomyces sp. NPDC048629 TaxID=3154824 RepID=UPI0034238245